MDERTQIQEDLAQLAGNMVHRGANTLSEQRAADYVRRRLEERAPYTHTDAFHATDNPLAMLAAFYGEFVFVAIIAHWLPIVAFAYGVVVFFFYLAEHTGYATVSRLFPQYESQNVVARIPAERPRGRIVVTAHYDTAREGLLTSPWFERRARAFHFVLVFAMFCVLAGCALGAADPAGETIGAWAELLRWSASALLATVALGLLLTEVAVAGDSDAYARGANDNASGVAALIALSGRLAREPLADCDVWFVATGSSALWRSGMRHLMNDPELTSQPLWFIDINRVGAGSTALVVGEGLMYPFRNPRDVLRALERDPNLGALPRIFNAGYPSDLLLPLSRGYPAVGVTALPPDAPAQADADAARFDRPYDVRPERVVAATDVAETLTRLAHGWLMRQDKA